MDKGKFAPILAWLSFMACLAFGQDRFAVHYKYKPQTLYNLEAPEAFLLQKAIDRRIKEGIAVDSTDLPVAEKYVETITSMVESVRYHTKWMNASVVVATQEQIEEITALPFIDSVKLVARGFDTSGQNGKKESFKFPISLKLASNKVNTFDFQNDLLGIPAMHQAGFTGAGVMIAVFDAGFVNTDKISGLDHLFEQDQLVATKDFVQAGSDNVFRSDGHGTASLSLMASYEASKLISGAYDAQYILCITEDVESEFRIEEYNWIRAAEYSDSLGVDIINSSLGYNIFDDPQMDYQKEDLDGKTAVITVGASLAASKGILVISSAGNEGNGNWKTLTAPSDADGIIAVGSVDSNLERSGFSSIGPTFDGRIKPDLVAFGSGVTIWRRIDGPHTSSGTSFTSPQIAALAAGLWQGRPEWTRGQLIKNLLESGTLADAPNAELGYGIPNFLDAYFGELPDFQKQKELDRAVVYPNPLDGDQLFIEFGAGKKCNLKMTNASGQVVADLNLSRNYAGFPYEMSLENTKPGVYILECRENSQIQTFRLLRR